MSEQLPWSDLDRDVADQHRRATALITRLQQLGDVIERETPLVAAVARPELPFGRVTARALARSIELWRRRMALRTERQQLRMRIRMLTVRLGVSGWWRRDQ